MGRFSAILLVIVSAWSSCAGAQTMLEPSASFLGESPEDHAAVPLMVGDVNGDGLDDFLIRAAESDENGQDAGQVYLVLGNETGWQWDTSLDQADASFLGEEANDGAGGCASAAGDVNGDGFEDFLIGARVSDPVEPGSGQIYLLLGRAAGWTMHTVLDQADASFLGDGAYRFVCQSAGGSDLDGDGYDDILIGSESNAEAAFSAGKVYVFFGGDAGWTMSSSLDTADASFLGEAESDYAGKKLAMDGDVNGDGLEDALIGAPWNDESGYLAGKTYVVFGREAGWTLDLSLEHADASFVGENPVDACGSPIAIAGDLDGDGLSEMLFGAYSNDEGGSNAGQVYLVFGRTTGWNASESLANADASFIGEQPGDFAGVTLSGGGDTDGDGLSDFLVGAQGGDVGVGYGKS